jgi:hypothetical protein
VFVSGKFEYVDTFTSSQVVRVCPASHDDKQQRAEKKWQFDETIAEQV